VSRSVMLQKIRRACVGADSAELPTELPEFPHYSDPVAKFRQELEKVGGVFLDGRRSEELSTALSIVLKQSDSTEIYWEGEELFQKHGLSFTLRNPEAFAKGSLLYSFHFRHQVQFPIILNSKPGERRDLARISLSASGARFGIAETGTIVHQVTAGTGRLLSLLPAAHLVLLSEQDLLMNHSVFFRSTSPGDYGSAMTLVTGPSRTADIEKTLVIGVHGPKRLFVILTP